MKKYLSNIFTGAACAGIFITFYEVRNAAKKEVEINEEIIINDNDKRIRKRKTLSKKDIRKLYRLPMCTCVVTIFLVLAAQSTNDKQKNKIYSNYALLAGTFLEYRDNISEIIGKEDEADIRSSVTIRGGEYKIPEGKDLYFETVFKIPFVANKDDILRAFNEINRIYAVKGYVGMKDYYKSLKLPVPRIAYDFGWCNTIQSEHGQPNWIDILTVEKFLPVDEDEPGSFIKYFALTPTVEPVFNYEDCPSLRDLESQQFRNYYPYLD